MNTEELIIKNKSLEEELQKIKEELYTTKEHLKKYTSPTRHKTYYDNHKEEILEKMKQKPPVVIYVEKRKSNQAILSSCYKQNIQGYAKTQY